LSLDTLSVDLIKANLRTKFIGKEIKYFEEIGSTNDIAKELARKGASEGLLVISERQTGGRGRRGRSWHSPSGGIWLSLILRPKLVPQEVPKLTFVAAIAVARVIRSLDLNAEIKWPNDILIDCKKKICGILCETEVNLGYVVVGIGVNANFNKEYLPEELQETATTLKSELNKNISRNHFVAHLLNEFEDFYLTFLEKGFSPIIDVWKKFSCILGENVLVYQDDTKFFGKAIDIDQSGALILKLKNGSLTKIFSGDVSIRRQK